MNNNRKTNKKSNNNIFIVIAAVILCIAAIGMYMFKQNGGKKEQQSERTAAVSDSEVEENDTSNNKVSDNNKANDNETNNSETNNNETNNSETNDNDTKNNANGNKTNDSTSESDDAADKNGKSEKIISKGKSLKIPVSDISSTVSFYPIKVDGVEMEIIAVKDSDGEIRTAFNTCQVCYSSGRGYYKQDGDVLVCQNCGNQFTIDDIGVEAGGCNPWAIMSDDRTIKNGKLEISYDYLKESEQIFSNWKAGI